MQILASDLNPQETYKLITGVVVPRPIAWVGTRSPDGVLNLAPFSAFTFVSTKPPLLGINVGRKAGIRKDTGRNILSTGEYVVHIGDETQVDLIHDSAEEHPPHVSEVELLKLDVTPSERIAVPRLLAPPIAMECKLHRIIPFGDTGAEFIVGEVLVFHVRDGLMRGGKIDSSELRPVCRLAGPNYGMLGRVVTLKALVQTEKSVMTDRGTDP